MREEKIQLPTSDGHVIFGTMNTAGNNAVIIFVHGFTGHQNEHHYFNAVPFFLPHHFDTCRFDFYGRKKTKGRPLAESSLTTHKQDLETVIQYCAKQYKKIIVVGHSLGPLVILQSDLSQVSQIVLWDPTTPFHNPAEKHAVFHAELDKYVFEWEMDFIVSKEMVDEWMAMDLQKYVQELSVPCKIIFAGNSEKYDAWQQYLPHFSVENEHVVVDDATHIFVEKGTEKKLFEETLRWIQ